ncbi:peroxisomal adenine nucleotide transporter 1 [Diutina catenulata]
MSETEELAHAIAGAGGGALSMVVTYPLVTLSTIAQTKKKDPNAPKSISDQTSNKIVSAIKNSGTYQALLEILRTKGPLGLYSGLESALYGITLTNFIYYYFYELASGFFLKRNGKRGLSTYESILTGAIAGAITCVGSNPFWVANTRMMTNQKKDGKATSSTFRTLIEIIQNDGVGTLFAGVMPALVLVVNPIIQYTIFEQIKNAIIAKNGAKSFTAVKAFFIGAFGKLIATALTYPYITLKSRMHLRKKAVGGDKLSMVAEIRKIIKDEGVGGLYGGLAVKLTQSITTAAFLFYFKEELLTGSIRLVSVLKALKANQTRTV